MTTHNRRKGYWPYYEMAKEQETSHMKKTLLQVIEENPRPQSKSSGRGRPPKHSEDFACLLMMADNETYRGVEDSLKNMKLPWNEPVYYHTTLVRHMQTIPEDWLDLILAETARRCLDAASGANGPLGADSSGVTTTRYEAKSEPEVQNSRRKKHWKYHITAVLGLQVILSAFCTSGSVHDVNMLLPMLEKIKYHGFNFPGTIFNADSGYDAEYVFEHLFWLGMFPNIKQRKGATNQDKPNRKKAAEMFDSVEYAETNDRGRIWSRGNTPVPATLQVRTR